MKKENNFLYILINIIIVTLLVALLIVINVNGPLLNEKSDETTTTKTTTKEVKIIEEVGEVNTSIMIEGLEENFKATTLKSYLGFTINYDKELFSYRIEDKRIIFENIYDKENFIEVLILDNNKVYNDIAKESVIKGENTYIYTYKSLDNGNTYLKITKSLIDNPEYDGLSIRMDYIIDSIKFTEN